MAIRIRGQVMVHPAHRRDLLASGAKRPLPLPGRDEPIPFRQLPEGVLLRDEAPGLLRVEGVGAKPADEGLHLDTLGAGGAFLGFSGRVNRIRSLNRLRGFLLPGEEEENTREERRDHQGDQKPSPEAPVSSACERPDDERQQEPPEKRHEHEHGRLPSPGIGGIIANGGGISTHPHRAVGEDGGDLALQFRPSVTSSCHFEWVLVGHEPPLINWA
jgi:hypothetical protein